MDYTYLLASMSRSSAALKLVVVEPQRGSKFLEDMFTIFTTSFVFLVSAGINMEVILLLRCPELLQARRYCLHLMWFMLSRYAHSVTTRLVQASPSFTEVSCLTHNCSDIFGVSSTGPYLDNSLEGQGFRGLCQ